jgi:ribosome maturation factor RimP
LNFERELSKNEKLILKPLEEVLKELKLNLYDFDFQQGSSTFRVFIFDEVTKTASLENCIAVDRKLSLFFEECDQLPENITLEVSSPGIYRLLKQRFHFDMSLNEPVKVKLSMPIDGLKGKVLDGTLEKVDETFIHVRQKKNDILFEVMFNNIKSVQADYKF